ncbi:MAG: NAD-dependent deacylase [Deltaproteobacteria bacterium]|nr:MAG: NAD-dependent deacylase [Deltaproteobacteria bacterium]
MDPLHATADFVRRADRILVVTGAGMSADSGLPTYRGVGGLYEDADTPEGLAIEDVLSGTMLHANPALCWRYIREIEEACRGAGHNAGHTALVALEKYAQVVVVTQNVDGFHRDAGSSTVLELHGNLRRLYCVSCRRGESRRDFDGLPIPPHCPYCGGLLRPDVVLFGEMLPSDTVNRFYMELGLGFDLVLSVGTSSLFPYIAEPVIRARQEGVPTVEINPGDTTVSRFVRVHWRERAAVALPALIEALA